MAPQPQTKILKMMYSGNLEHITCPIKAKYEECIEIARERFDIPMEFKNFIQISNGSRYIFEKYTFDYFNLLFPNPEIIFYLKLDYTGLLGSIGSQERTPFTKLNNKRKDSDDAYEHEGVPVTRQNCFIGSLAGINASGEEEPMPKKQRIVITKSKSAGAVKKISSRRSIRI